MLSNEQMHRYNLIWEKSTPTGFLNANKMPLRCHEDIMVFYNHLPTYNPQKTTGHKRKVSTSIHKKNCAKTPNYGDYGLTTYDSTERYPKSVLFFPTDKQKESLHPTQKPLGIIEYLVYTYTNEGDLVLDNCAGSGTTGIACIRTKRNYVLIEKEEKYFEIINQRIKKEEYRLQF